ncbi:MAG: hypothetical protein Q9M97_08145 [Candidatus Gracilibacteria bacterium]|nr:hypothetical protein [Candidatus Gracilibacteria bacterium]
MKDKEILELILDKINNMDKRVGLIRNKVGLIRNKVGLIRNKV